MFSIPHQILGGACSTYEGEERYVQGFGGETWKRDHLEDPGVDGRVILNGFSGSGMGGVDWIDLTQDREKVAGCCECGNEPSGCIKSGKFLD